MKNPPASARLRFNPWSGKMPHAAERLSPWATNAELVPWSPEAEAAEARVPESLTPQQGRRPQLDGGPGSPRLEEKPAQPQIKHNSLKN